MAPGTAQFPAGGEHQPPSAVWPKQELGATQPEVHVPNRQLSTLSSVLSSPKRGKAGPVEQLARALLDSWAGRSHQGWSLVSTSMGHSSIKTSLPMKLGLS